MVGLWFCRWRWAAVGCKVVLVREVPGLLPVCSPLEGRFFSLLLAGRDVEPCGTVGWPRDGCALREANPSRGLLQLGASDLGDRLPGLLSVLAGWGVKHRYVWRWVVEVVAVWYVYGVACLVSGFTLGVAWRDRW